MRCEAFGYGVSREDAVDADGVGGVVDCLGLLVRGVMVLARSGVGKRLTG